MKHEELELVCFSSSCAHSPKFLGIFSAHPRRGSWLALRSLLLFLCVVSSCTASGCHLESAQKSCLFRRRFDYGYHSCPFFACFMEVDCQFEMSYFAGMDTAFTVRVHIANFYQALLDGRAVAVACLCLSTMHTYVYQVVLEVQYDKHKKYHFPQRKRIAIRYTKCDKRRRS